MNIIKTPAFCLALLWPAVGFATGDPSDPDARCFGGLTHRPLGQAALTVDHDQLIVSNLGSSGEDGVRVEVGQTYTFETALHSLESAPAGSSLSGETLGTTPGVGDEFPIMSFAVTRTPADWTLTTDFPGFPGASAEILIFREGELVTHRPLQGTVSFPAAPATLSTGFHTLKPAEGPCPPGLNEWYFCEDYGSFNHSAALNFCNGVIKTKCLAWGCSVSFNNVIAFAAGNEIFDGDQVVVHPGPIDPPSQIKAVELSGHDLPLFVLSDERIEHSLVNVGAIGNATLEKTPSVLQIANLGSAGQDGVSLHLGGAKGWEAELDLPTDLSAAGVGLESELRGRVNGMDDRVIGAGSVVGTGDGAMIHADFSTIGSNQSVVRLLDAADVQVAQFVIDNSAPLLIADDGPLQLKFVGWRCEPEEDIAVYRWCGDIEVDFDDGLGTPGSWSNVRTVEIAAVFITEEREFISGGSLTALGTGAFGIVAITDPDDDDEDDERGDEDRDGLSAAEEFVVGTDPQNPDTDGDGLLDGIEVNELGTSPVLADTDGDGVDDGVEVAAGSDPLDPANLVFDGLPHTALGQASLDASSGQLEISNLGSSGDDGVRIETGGTLKFETDLTPLGPSDSRAEMTFDALGTFNGQENQPMFSAHLERLPGAPWTFSADFPALGGNGLEVFLYRDGELVAELPLQAAVSFSATPTGLSLGQTFMAEESDGEDCPQGGMKWYHCTKLPGQTNCPGSFTPNDPDVVNCCASINSPIISNCSGPVGAAVDFDDGVEVTVGGSVIIADQVLIHPGFVNPVAPISAVEHGASHLPAVLLANEKIEHDFVTVQALGDAVFVKLPEGLKVANLGSAGQDGLSIDLGDGTCGWEADLDISAGLGLTATGVEIRSSIRGRVGGVDDTVVGLGTLQGTGDGAQLQVDFSGIGSTRSEVRLFDGNGVEIAAFEIDNGDPMQMKGDTSFRIKFMGFVCKNGKEVAVHKTCGEIEVEVDDGEGPPITWNNVVQVEVAPVDVAESPELLTTGALTIAVPANLLESGFFTITRLAITDPDDDDEDDESGLKDINLNQDGSVEIVWQSTVGQLYFLDESTDLVNWTRVADRIAADSGETTTYRYTGPRLTQQFFRVGQDR